MAKTETKRASTPPYKRISLTTGEAATATGLSQQTIIRACDSGLIPSFRIPDSRFRRIPRVPFIEYLKANNIPFVGLEPPEAVAAAPAAPGAKDVGP